MFGELTRYGQRLPNNCRVGFAHYVSLKEAALNPDVERYVQRLARDAIADTISGTKVERAERDHCVEFRCELYVFHPDDFWQIVETAAYEIADRYSASLRDTK